MKQPVILLTLCFALLCHLAKAQTSFEETYKKAYGFTTTNADSALFWIQKCTKLAKNQEQLYKVYYLSGFNANRLCLFGSAMKNYTKALSFAIDSLSYYRANIALAKTLLSTGNLTKSFSLNQKSIHYNLQHKQWNQLSYAYDLKAWILRKQNDYSALSVSRQALKLKKRYTPNEIGYGYKNLAEIFEAFNLLDSAIVYQKKALATYPIQTPEQQAFLQIQLAKYYIFNDQATLAKPHLQVARSLKKRPLTEVQFSHVQGLYYSKTGQNKAALAEFARSDSLLEVLLTEAPDVVTRQTIDEQAKQLYQDALELKQLPPLVRLRYQNRLKLSDTRLTSYRTELSLRDRIQQQKLLISGNNVSKTTDVMIWIGVGLLIVASLLSNWLWWRRVSRRSAIKNAYLTLALNEQKLMGQLEVKLGQPLPQEWYYPVMIYYREGTITKVADILHVSRPTVRKWLTDLGKAVQIDSMKEFIDQHREQKP